MANRSKVLTTLDTYFKTKGRVLGPQEYARETDTPIRLQQVRNVFGTWNRMEKLLMARDRQDPDAMTNVNDVIAARQRAENEARLAWIAASENQDAKAVREAQAQHVAEKLAANAATAEGANANKIAIGGPLPAEQPDYTKMGATVNTDPVTKEQTVVDVQPEIITPELTDPRTPGELRAAVAAAEVTETGEVKTGDATSGGSQGQPSIATVAALGADEPVEPVVDVKDDKKTSAKK